MKVNLKIFLPTLSEVVCGKELELEFDGNTVNDLVDRLIYHSGNRARQALCDEEGNLDPTIMVLLDGERWITHDKLDMIMDNGDDLVLMLMVAGAGWSLL